MFLPCLIKLAGFALLPASPPLSLWHVRHKGAPMGCQCSGVLGVLSLCTAWAPLAALTAQGGPQPTCGPGSSCSADEAASVSEA